MIWGCMSGRGVAKLQIIDGTINADKYKIILAKSLLASIPMCQSAEGESIFQQDGAPCHTSKSVKTWFNEHQIPILP